MRASRLPSSISVSDAAARRAPLPLPTCDFMAIRSMIPFLPNAGDRQRSKAWAGGSRPIPDGQRAGETPARRPADQLFLDGSAARALGRRRAPKRLGPVAWRWSGCCQHSQPKLAPGARTDDTFPRPSSSRRRAKGAGWRGTPRRGRSSLVRYGSKLPRGRSVAAFPTTELHQAVENVLSARSPSAEAIDWWHA